MTPPASGPRARPRTRALRAALGAGAAALLLAGCGASASRVSGARTAGEEFVRVTASGDYEAGCRLLAPDTRDALEQQGHQECGPALGAEDLPKAGAVRATEVHGRQALLRLDGDTLFLSLFHGGWKVVAAGCTPQGEQPYQCELKGG